MDSRRTSQGAVGPRVSGLVPGLAPALVLGALVALLGCGQSPIETTRAGLIGLRATALRTCIGVPTAVDQDGDTEYLTYRFFEQQELDSQLDVLPTRETRKMERYGAGESSEPPTGISYCELVFEVRDRRVRHVEVDGRTARGLNDDLQCMRKARACVPGRR